MNVLQLFVGMLPLLGRQGTAGRAEPIELGADPLGAGRRSENLLVVACPEQADQDCLRHLRPAGRQAKDLVETEAEKVRAWLRTPTTDETRVRDEKKAELNSIQERLAEARGKLKAMEGNAQGVPVAVSRKAFDRAKTAGVLGMAAIIFGSAAGVLGVFTGGQ